MCDDTPLAIGAQFVDDHVEPIRTPTVLICVPELAIIRAAETFDGCWINDPDKVAAWHKATMIHAITSLRLTAIAACQNGSN